MNNIDKMIAGLDPEDLWVPAKLEHLLCLRASCPELVPNGTVVALGTKKRGLVPKLGPKGELGEHFGGSFNSDIFFLIVRRKKN